MVTAQVARRPVGSNNSPDEMAYDYLAGGADRFLLFSIVGYNEDNLDVIHTMLTGRATIAGKRADIDVTTIAVGRCGRIPPPSVTAGL
jgi:hypothetical protein